MSHVADVAIKFRDIEACASAVALLGGELRRDQKTHAWYGRFLNDWQSQSAAVNRRDASTFGKCDMAIHFPGVEYEIGLCQEADGSYTAVYDTYGSSGQRLMTLCGGMELPRLKNEYAAAVSTRMLARKGFRVTRSLDAKTGEIILKARS